MRQLELSRFQAAQAWASYNSGFSWPQIADEMGVCTETIRRTIEIYHLRPEHEDPKVVFRRKVNRRLRAGWGQPDFNLAALSRELGLSPGTLRTYGYQIGLGRRYARHTSEPRPVPARVNGVVVDYKGRRYEDDPRDPPCTSPILMRAGFPHGSLVGNAAEMCASE